MRRRHSFTAVLLLLTACGGPGGNAGPGTPGGPSGGNGGPGPGSPSAPAISRFDARDVGVFVGERTQLTAVFSGDSAEIDGVGPVTSGTPVDTPVLPASRTFTLTVHKGGQAARATVTVAVRYRARIRQLPDAAVARKAHVAVSLPDGSALVMGGNTSESINVPDTNTSSRFDAASEAFTRGPDLAFSAAVDTGFTILLPLRTGFLLAGGGINAGIGLQTPGTLLSQTFDPAGQTFTRAGDLQVHHLGTGSGTLLADGRVLLSGGGLPGIAETEVYDPGSRAWTKGSPMGTARRLDSVTLLRDGRVLIAGGFVCCVVEGQTVSETSTVSAELDDSDDGKLHPHRVHGRCAGTPPGDAAPRRPRPHDRRVRGLAFPGTEHAEVYHPATGTFSAAGDLQVGRFLHRPSP